MNTPTTFEFNPTHVPVDLYERCEFCGAAGAPLRRVTESHSRRQCWDSVECEARQNAEATAMAEPCQNAIAGDTERFWRRVLRPRPGACWLWTGRPNGSGYGVFHVGRRAFYAHRYSFALANGHEAAGDVHHLCHIRLCVNPAHLVELTASQNRREGILSRWPNKAS